MITFDQWLLKLIQGGRVSIDDAMQAVSSKHDFELALQQAGIAVPRHHEQASEPEPADPKPEAPEPFAEDAFTGAPAGA